MGAAGRETKRRQSRTIGGQRGPVCCAAGRRPFSSKTQSLSTSDSAAQKRASPQAKSTASGQPLTPGRPDYACHPLGSLLPDPDSLRLRSLHRPTPSVSTRSRTFVKRTTPSPVSGKMMPLSPDLRRVPPPATLFIRPPGGNLSRYRGGFLFDCRRTLLRSRGSRGVSQRRTEGSRVIDPGARGYKGERGCSPFFL